jgi:hypothetical protein
MSESSAPNTEELAYLLWERQGRPANRAAQNWVEAEYLAHPPTAAQPTDRESEVDLRMRGLGPLTQTGIPGESKAPAGRLKNRTVLLLSCLAGVSLVTAAGMIFSSSHRRWFDREA